MWDHVLFVVEILLLIGILIQGESIRKYEKWTYEMNRERWEERAKWRQAKQKQQLKRSEPSSSGAKNTESLPPLTTPSENPKDGAAESADDTKASLGSI